MTQRPPSIPPTRRARGFTLIELLVVIGIIVLLISILLPVAGRVRIQAQSATTSSSMTAIASAIERYYQDYHAYPGIFSNAQMCGGAFGAMPAITFTPTVGSSVLTSSENLAGALMGGIEPVFDNSGTITNFTVNADAGMIGKGPLNASPAPVYRTRKAPYLDINSSYLPSQPFSASGCAGLDVETIGMAGGMDTVMPEFRDAYSSSRRPIIYLRANVGVDTLTKPVCTPVGTKDPTAAQYNTFEFTAYKRGAVTPSSDFPGDFSFGTAPAGDFEFYANEADYLRNPNAPYNTGTRVGTPRGKDKFILISAGPDHCFGTKDDIFYGGN